MILHLLISPLIYKQPGAFHLIGRWSRGRARPCLTCRGSCLQNSHGGVINGREELKHPEEPEPSGRDWAAVEAF